MDLGLIVQIVGYVYIGLQALRGVLIILKGVLNMIPGDQGEAFIEKVEGIVLFIENILAKIIPSKIQKID